MAHSSCGGLNEKWKHHQLNRVEYQSLDLASSHFYQPMEEIDLVAVKEL
jgi:hypothetical protein